MKNESEVRICKNKNCKKALPEGYKYKYCEACRNQRAHIVKGTLKGIVAAAAGVVAIVTMKHKD